MSKKENDNSLGILDGIILEKYASSIDNKKDNPSPTATGALGLGLMAGSKDKIIGQKTLYHGTSNSAFEEIKRHGMKADKGGTGGASGVASHGGSDNIADASKGKVYLTKKKGKAFAYSRRSATADAIKTKLTNDEKVQRLNEIRKKHRLGKGKYDFDLSTPEGRKSMKEVNDLARYEKWLIRKEMANPKNREGKVIKVKMDYNKWKNDFELDPDETGAKVHRMFGGSKMGEAIGKDFAARTSKDVTKDEIVGLHNAGSRIAKRMKNLPNYIKTNPKRFGAGVVMAGLGTGLVGKSVKDIEKQVRDRKDMYKKALYETIVGVEKQALTTVDGGGVSGVIDQTEFDRKVAQQNFGTRFAGSPTLRAEAGANNLTTSSSKSQIPSLNNSQVGVKVAPSLLNTPTLNTPNHPVNAVANKGTTADRAKNLFSRMSKLN